MSSVLCVELDPELASLRLLDADEKKQGPPTIEDRLEREGEGGTKEESREVPRIKQEARRRGLYRGGSRKGTVKTKQEKKTMEKTKRNTK